MGRNYIKIDIEEYDLWRLILKALSGELQWPECMKFALPTNAVILALKDYIKLVDEKTNCETCHWFFCCHPDDLKLRPEQFNLCPMYKKKE